MSNETKSVRHTAGAIKAAKLIARSDKLRPLVFGDVLRDTAAESFAEIIDRETSAPELLEALELLHRVALQAPALNNPDDREVIDQAWAAIRKAKGEL
jgi:hypothetical protein